MNLDKFAATWVSHSSIGDFLACPRAYYLNNVYKDPSTRHKISLMNPPLALGQAVHEVVESLSVLPTDERFRVPLSEKFEKVWQKVSGEKGGFSNEVQEREYKNRGLQMISYVVENPGPINNLAIKLSMDLPYYWLSEEDEVILCGKIDWLEYLPDTDGVHIIDFKTGRREEGPESLQLPIYHLLVSNCQKREVEKVSYWYLSQGKPLIAQKLPDLKKAHEKVLKIAKRIKLQRKLDKFECGEGDGCYACRPLEKIVEGKAKFVGVNDFRQDVYVLESDSERPDSVIL